MTKMNQVTSKAVFKSELVPDITGYKVTVADKNAWNSTIKLAAFANNTIFASNYGFTNSTGDAKKLKDLIETVEADILYLDTNILIDTGIIISHSRIRKIVGLSGTITITNKGESNVPFIKWEYCNDMVFERITFRGDFNRALTTDIESQNTIVSAMFFNLCNNVTIFQCELNNIIGAGAIWVRNSVNFLIHNNNIIDCWNHITGDIQGDGIYVGSSSRVQVLNNYIRNNFSNKDEFGRIGITFEFDSTNGCVCMNNYIYGYDRAIHIELVSGNSSILIKNNVTEGCAMGFVGWHNNNTEILIEGNYFSNLYVPTDYISQILVGSKAFILFLTNTPEVEINRNTIFKNNTCVLEVTVPGIDFIFTKISGESYLNNDFLDKNRASVFHFYNPHETEMNNNHLDFSGNSVNGGTLNFAHIGSHQINNNKFNVNSFMYLCTPTPTLNSFYRQIIGNELKNQVDGVENPVNSESYIFRGLFSIYCRDNIFINIGWQEGQSDSIFQWTESFPESQYLKSIIEGNTLISTLPDNTVSKFFFARFDGMVNPTISNRHINFWDVSFEQSGMQNSSLIVTSPDGSERVIEVDELGALSTSIIRWK